MPDDARVKRVLKRYPREAQLSDASIEVTGISTADLQAAFGCAADDPIYTPRQLAGPQMAFFRDRLKAEFEPGEFDYFLHAYVRSEHTNEYFATPSAGPHPAPESGPPGNIMPDKVWVSVR